MEEIRSGILMKRDLKKLSGSEIHKELIKTFPNLPNYEQNPIVFTWYVKLYDFYKMREN
jgi:hypothetical protein